MSWTWTPDSATSTSTTGGERLTRSQIHSRIRYRRRCRRIRRETALVVWVGLALIAACALGDSLLDRADQMRLDQMRLDRGRMAGDLEGDVPQDVRKTDCVFVGESGIVSSNNIKHSFAFSGITAKEAGR